MRPVEVEPEIEGVMPLNVGDVVIDLPLKLLVVGQRKYGVAEFKERGIEEFKLAQRSRG